jgi:hypothetical protein
MPEGTFVKENGVVLLEEERPHSRKKPRRVFIPFCIVVYLLSLCNLDGWIWRMTIGNLSNAEIEEWVDEGRLFSYLWEY